MSTTLVRVTEQELLRLPKNGRKYELVNGEVREVPTGDRHDAIVARMIFLIYPFTQGRGMVCGSQAGFRMATGNVRAPDVSFTRKERLPGGRAPDGFGNFAPDLCIEVISPSEEETESFQKVREYFAFGAEQVWHLFPHEQRVTVYQSPSESQEYNPNDELEAGSLLPGFRHQVADLFAVD